MPPRKRSAPDALDAADNGRRRSGRLSSTSLTKSKYFEDSSNESEGDAPPKKRGRPTKKAAKKEVEEAEDLYQDQSDPDGGVQEDDDEGEEDEDDDDDESKPMKVTILPLEKMRDTGGVEYEDSKLHKNSLLFLKDLKANNKRSWLKCEQRPSSSII
jgi:hypothetical protein